jgi:hypothetical protein
MRYKKVRWAAMEFLLKSQKKNRRRLIIEQLILLALRCLLVFLAVLLVSRLLKFTLGDYEFAFGRDVKPKTVHVVLLDDSLSMNDWVEDPERVKLTNCFEVAKEVINTEIAANAARSTVPQDLVLVRMSELAVEKDRYRPKTYEDLRVDGTRDELKKDLEGFKCSSLHIPLLDAVKRAQEIAGADANKENQVVVHILSDFRYSDWAAGDVVALSGAVAKLAAKGKINLIDCVHPYRAQTEADLHSHDNVAIAQFYPETRVVASKAYVRFKMIIENYSPNEKEVRVELFDPEKGRRLFTLEKGKSEKVPSRKSQAEPGRLVTNIDAQFDRPKDGYVQVSAKLVLTAGKAGDDGLVADNIRHTAVYVRASVPVLIIDGDPKRGEQDGGDTYHISEALTSEPGSAYEITSGGVGLLDSEDLGRYPSIYLLNVASFTPEQVKKLESYAANGGSIAFFLGKDVDGPEYNKTLYRDKGPSLFPLKLADTFTPERGKSALQPDLDDDHYKALLRDKLFPTLAQYPIFGSMAQNEMMRETFKSLAVYRYWEIANLEAWRVKPKAGVQELLTMPNLDRVSKYARAARDIRKQLDKLSDKFPDYSSALMDYSKKINTALEPGKHGRPKDCGDLADALGKLLHDTGTATQRAAPGTQPPARPAPREQARPDMTKFWKLKGTEDLFREVSDLYKTVRYGHPLVVTSRFGRGRIVAVMTSAGNGKDKNDKVGWNGWLALPSYVPMILDMQSYLTSLGEEANLTVGTSFPIELPMKVYDRKVKRTFYLSALEQAKGERRAKPAEPDEDNPEDKKPKVGEEEEADKQVREEEAERDDAHNRYVYTVGGALTPGFYLYELTLLPKKGEKKARKEQRGFAFNVDAEHESNLDRVNRTTLMDTSLHGVPAENVKLTGPFEWGQELAERQTDFSEAPWFFLIFLIVLVAEQALAVHLSFHLRDSTPVLPAQAVRSQALAG